MLFFSNLYTIIASLFISLYQVQCADFRFHSNDISPLSSSSLTESPSAIAMFTARQKLTGSLESIGAKRSHPMDCHCCIAFTSHCCLQCMQRKGVRFNKRSVAAQSAKRLWFSDAHGQGVYVPLNTEELHLTEKEGIDLDVLKSMQEALAANSKNAQANLASLACICCLERVFVHLSSEGWSCCDACFHQP